MVTTDHLLMRGAEVLKHLDKSIESWLIADLQQILQNLISQWKDLLIRVVKKKFKILAYVLKWLNPKMVEIRKKLMLQMPIMRKKIAVIHNLQILWVTHSDLLSMNLIASNQIITKIQMLWEKGARYFRSSPMIGDPC